MTEHASQAASLTKNQSLVMTALSDAKGPMSAYSILDELREHGFRAPLQVYRALEKLLELGLVHRLESLNAFVACQHPSCDASGKEDVLFTICGKCGKVEELVDNGLIASIKNLAGEVEFSLKETVIELRGFCSACK